ncbi:MAG: CdaR family protein [Myxococcota bacterium]|nr:CdaR family protein [Myxococcota bacterium]
MLKDRLNRNIKQFFYGFTQNLGLKAIAFTASITIWVWVQTKQVTEESFRSQIKFLLPDNLVLVNKPTRLVNITLTGPTGRMRILQETPLETNIDLRTQESAGTMTTNINIADIKNIPEGFKVARISPPSVEIELDELIKRSIKISANVVGTPKKGWYLKESRVFPEFIDVQGARSVIGKMATVKTMGISLNNLSKTVKINDVQLNLEHPSMKPATETPIEVLLEFQLNRSKQKFDDLPLSTPSGWEADPQRVPILIEGLALDIDGIEKKDLTLKFQLPKDFEQSEFNVQSPQLDPKLFTLFNNEKPLNVTLSTPLESIRFYRSEE